MTPENKALCYMKRYMSGRLANHVTDGWADMKDVREAALHNYPDVQTKVDVQAHIAACFDNYVYWVKHM